ncbi:MAG TPA: NADPH:quinone reductase [Pyrinomonadaceae bacterium]|nr:NADPH:quinone reductase [Pyrinomonadaceae bacterium]
MKAIRVHELGAPEVMHLEDVDIPKPTGTQVLVKVHAIGVNPVETYVRSGNYAKIPTLPYTPGKDAAGIVEEVGDGVAKWNVGDRVYTANSISGTYAEYTLVDEVDLGRLPENTTFEQGAGIWTPYATAYKALFQKAKAASGESVLVHGASGGVGIACVQWAKNRGLTVIGTASSDTGKQLVLEQGANVVLDHSKEGYLSEINEWTGGIGVDIVIEMLANVNLAKDFEVLKMFGRISIVGNRGSLDFNPRLIMGKDATITGGALHNTPREDLDEIHREVFDGLDKGYLHPVVSRQFPIANAVEAHHAVIEDKALGKMVLIP